LLNVKTIMLIHSHSSIKDFQGCARRYQQVRILKRFKSQPTEATTYGNLVHEAIEKFLKDGTELPEHLQRHTEVLEGIRDMPGQRFCEEKLGLRKDFTPCGFFDKDVWFRGIPDLLVVNNEIAWLADWKTGKSSRYADISQLELMAAMTMAHHPSVLKVKAMLFFLVPGDVIQARYYREQMPDILSRWAGHAAAIEDTVAVDVWNATPSGLCKFCPVSQDVCEHR
jgi:hypothetical protein